jgi:hypothetical protein
MQGQPQPPFEHLDISSLVPSLVPNKKDAGAASI